MMFTFERQGMERVTRVTALGMRFWDSVRNAAVSDGLEVSAYLPGQPGRRVGAVVNRAAVYFFPHLPGLHDVEFGLVEPNNWNQPQVRRSFVIEVRDRLGRYQPFKFEAQAPTAGLFVWDNPLLSSESLPHPVPAAIPLFASAAYRAPASMAVVRADLRQLAGGHPQEPAAWAVLQAVRAGYPTVWGLADKLGKVALIFPYPEVARSSGPSGNVGMHIPLTDQSWVFGLHARFQPTQADQDIPDLQQVLAAASVRLWDRLSPAVELQEVTLKFGEELILRTKPEGLYSELLLSP